MRAFLNRIADGSCLVLAIKAVGAAVPRHRVFLGYARLRLWPRCWRSGHSAWQVRAGRPVGGRLSALPGAVARRYMLAADRSIREV